MFKYKAHAILWMIIASVRKAPRRRRMIVYARVVECTIWGKKQQYVSFTSSIYMSLWFIQCWLSRGFFSSFVLSSFFVVRCPSKSNCQAFFLASSGRCTSMARWQLRWLSSAQRQQNLPKLVRTRPFVLAIARICVNLQRIWLSFGFDVRDMVLMGWFF